jgi:hypothetical protein
LTGHQRREAIRRRDELREPVREIACSYNSRTLGSARWQQKIVKIGRRHAPGGMTETPRLGRHRFDSSLLPQSLTFILKKGARYNGALDRL